MSRSTARKAACEPAWRIVVPSADTAASGRSEATIAGHCSGGSDMLAPAGMRRARSAAESARPPPSPARQQAARRANRPARSLRSSPPASQKPSGSSTGPTSSRCWRDGIAVGHPGDEVADRRAASPPRRPRRPAIRAAAGPDPRDRRRTGGRRRACAWSRTAVTGGALYMRAWRKRFSIAPPPRPCAGEKPASGRPAPRTSSAVSTPARRSRRAVSSSTSPTIRPIWSRTSSGTSRASSTSGKRARTVGPGARDQRHLEQLLEREQAGAQAVVNVVIVVGDVVRDRRDLRLQARPGRQVQREFRDPPRPAPRAGRQPARYAWPAPRASPS